MKNKKIFALVDCNNFYASCERVFSPRYENKPVIVLSNNDGCVISRSQEAKDLGVKMGAPLFNVRDRIKKHDIKLFSSNYTLYGDLSRRVIETLSGFTPDIEIYSIDEAFLAFEGLPYKSANQYGQKIRNTVKKWTGIPVSVGIAGTKTLAKIAGELSKKDKTLNGVFDLTSLSNAQRDSILKKFPVKDIWGIGYRYAHFLEKHGIHTALDFKNTDDRWVRNHMTVVGERTLRELRGTPCMSIEKILDPKKQIVSSRSFGKNTSSLTDLEQALSYYVTRACQKLRNQSSVASCINVFVMTSQFRTGKYFNMATKTLPAPTADTTCLISAAKQILRDIFLKDMQYKKVGIIISDIRPRETAQTDFFADNYSGSKKERLMDTVDKINKKWSHNTVSYASTGIQRKWMMKREYLSNKFTTDWNELPVVKAG